MCSKPGQSGGARNRGPDFAARLAAAIDAFAAAADQRDDAAAADLAARLASTWAMLTSADAELAERTDRYSELGAGNALTQGSGRSAFSAADGAADSA